MGVSATNLPSLQEKVQVRVPQVLWRLFQQFKQLALFLRRLRTQTGNLSRSLSTARKKSIQIKPYLLLSKTPDRHPKQIIKVGL